MIQIEYLDWDTINFGFKTGKVNLENITFDIYHIEEVINSIYIDGKKQGYKLLYLFCDRNTLISKKNSKNIYDIVLADTKIIYTKDIINSNFQDTTKIYSYNKSYPSKQLLDLTFTSGQYSRFKLDKHFSENIFIKIYTKWIERSVSKEIAKDVLVYEDNRNLIGMLTYKCEQDLATIGLIAVNPIYQGRKVGTEILNKLENDLHLLGINKINVATQFNNTLACKFYEKNSFIIKHTSNIYHLWL